MSNRRTVFFISDRTGITAEVLGNSLLSQFASPGSRTCILNNPHTYPLAELDGLFAAVGNELSVLTGPLAVPEPSADPYWDEYRIDEVGFSRFLDEWS